MKIFKKIKEGIENKIHEEVGARRFIVEYVTRRKKERIIDDIYNNALTYFLISDLRGKVPDKKEWQDYYNMSFELLDTIGTRLSRSCIEAESSKLFTTEEIKKLEDIRYGDLKKMKDWLRAYNNHTQSDNNYCIASWRKRAIENTTDMEIYHSRFRNRDFIEDYKKFGEAQKAEE